MKTLVAVVIATTLFTLAGVAAAATQTVTLAVKNMTCAVCPITVKKALNGVAGVSKTEVSYERKEAIVTFDDAKTNVEALIKATTNAGYPASVKAK
ncbi:MAG: mercury resistance system periplasmic binding protein MerP [Sulfuricaulis sp.]